MNTSNQKTLTTLLVIVLASMMTACGSSSVDSSTDLSSRTTATSTTDANNKALAYCNYGTSSVVSAKQKVYQDSSGYRMDYVWVKLTALPSGFSSSTSYIAMWKWLANSSGSAYIEPTALNFALYDTQTGKTLTSWKSALKWSDISATALSLGYSDPTSFFNRVTLLVNLNDPSGQYDVLKISVYNTSSSKAIGQLDSLLPLYSANPAAYATESDGSARASVLQKLHPFASYSGSGYTTAQFQSMAQAYCF